MRKTSIHSTLILIMTFSITLFLSLLTIVHAEQFKSTGTGNVYFSPDGGTTTTIVNELNSAKSEISVLA